MARYDAILIPGGGVRPGGVLPPWVAARFDRALELADGAWFTPLSAGTPHRPPPLDTRGFPITEARAGAKYLMARGVEPRRILVEASSWDTIGNAWFSRVVHAMPRGFERVLVVNSAFHMPRTEEIFRWVYGLEGPGPACAVAFETVPDTGMEPEVLRARMEKEAVALRELDGLRGRIRTLEELHQWLFAEHPAYAAGAGAEGAWDGRLQATY
jgi:hypothetical protein